MSSKQDIREFFSIKKPFESEEEEQRVKDENEEAAEIFQLNDDDDWGKIGEMSEVNFKN